MFAVFQRKRLHLGHWSSKSLNHIIITSPIDEDIVHAEKLHHTRVRASAVLSFVRIFRLYFFYYFYSFLFFYDGCSRCLFFISFFPTIKNKCSVSLRFMPPRPRSKNTTQRSIYIHIYTSFNRLLSIVIFRVFLVRQRKTSFFLFFFTLIIWYHFSFSVFTVFKSVFHSGKT